MGVALALGTAFALRVDDVLAGRAPTPFAADGGGTADAPLQGSATLGEVTGRGDGPAAERPVERHSERVGEGVGPAGPGAILAGEGAGSAKPSAAPGAGLHSE